MKKLVIYASSFVAIYCLLLIASRAKDGIAIKYKSAPTVVSQASAGISVGAYTAAGMPVTLQVGRLGNERGFNELPCRINLTAISEVERANLVLFELEATTGKLRGSESWTQRLGPLTAKLDDKGMRGHDFTLRMRHTLAEKNIVVLALESVSGSAGTWQVDYTDLFQTVANRSSGRPDTQVAVRQNADSYSNDYGSNYCARGFALATYLSKFSVNGGGMPAYSCDQQERSFAIAYFPLGKATTQTQ